MLNNRIGTHTHRLIGEDLNFNVRVIASGSHDYCKQLLEIKKNEISWGHLALKPSERIYIAAVETESVVWGPGFKYTVLGKEI